MSGVNEIEKG